MSSDCQADSVRVTIAGGCQCAAAAAARRRRSPRRRMWRRRNQLASPSHGELELASELEFNFNLTRTEFSDSES